MSRLTKKQLEYYKNTYDRYEGIECNEFEKICDELIEYKGLEAELGIDLITLFKALKDGIIVVDDNYECHGLSKYRGQEIDLNIFLKRLEIKFVGCWNLSDYGKTWDLSRNELEVK